jgi:hypothetical protein
MRLFYRPTFRCEVRPHIKVDHNGIGYESVELISPAEYKANDEIL